MVLIQLIILLFLPFLVRSTQSFSNKGTLSGFSTTNVEHSGSLQQVTNVYLEGPSALKATQIYDSSYSGRYHSEAVVNDGYKRGQTLFYAFSFRLQQDWQFSPVQSYNIAQWIADFGDTQPCDDFMPSSMIWLVGDQLYTRVRWGTLSSDPAKCNKQTKTFANIATISPGQFHTVVVQANWQSDSTGYYKLWLDGVKVLEQFNLPTTVADDRTFSFRVGLYANGWHDDGVMKGTQGTRQVWYDEIAVGTTFADVDPAQWNRKARSRVMRNIQDHTASRRYES